MICSNIFKRLKLIPTSVSLVLSYVIATPALAIDYDVEVIIFEHIRDTSVGSSDTLLLPVIENVELIPDVPIPNAPIQPIGELRLLEEVEKIKGSNNHRLLYHGGWRQADFDRENAPYMSISLGQSFNLLAEPEDVESNNISTVDSNISTTDEEIVEVKNTYLRGYTTPPKNRLLDLRQETSSKLFGGIKVWVGRFLHFDTLLSYTPDGAGYSFAFESERRMRSRQLNYIDHPRVGIVTKIYPVDETAPN